MSSPTCIFILIRWRWSSPWVSTLSCWCRPCWQWWTPSGSRKSSKAWWRPSPEGNMHNDAEETLSSPCMYWCCCVWYWYWEEKEKLPLNSFHRKRSVGNITEFRLLKIDLNVHSEKNCVHFWSVTVAYLCPWCQLWIHHKVPLSKFWRLFPWEWLQFYLILFGLDPWCFLLGIETFQFRFYLATKWMQ